MPDIFTKAYEYKNTLYAMLNMFEYIVPTAPYTAVTIGVPKNVVEPNIVSTL